MTGISSFLDVPVKGNKKCEMKNLTSMPFEYDDNANQQKLVLLWGDSLNKLTPLQRHLVVEILSNLNLTPVEAG